MHNAGMVNITIRDVPQSCRDELARRADLEGRSLQEYLKGVLVDVASKPDASTVVERIRRRVEGSERTLIPPDVILRSLREGREERDARL